MENEVKEIAGRKLHWPELGHVLRRFPDQAPIAALIATYGEIRLLYAVFLVDGIQAIGDEVIRQEVVQRALADNWLSDATQARLLEFQTSESLSYRLPIPWRDRYLQPEHVEDVERLAAWNRLAGGMPVPILEQKFSVESANVAPYLNRDGIDHDLRPDTLIMWLHFLMEGDSDPRLKEAYARHRPDLNLADYSRCVSAWSALGFSRATSEGLSKA